MLENHSMTNLPKYLMRHASAGYTLVELMVVVGIIGVISAISYGAYTGYPREADRAQAQSDLYEIAQVMERGYTTSQDYNSVTWDETFFENRNTRYDFSLTAAAPTATTLSTYTITAAPRTNSRDDFEMRINQFGVEEYRKSGTSSWTTGWDSIK